MGCWNGTCGLTNLPIFVGDEVYVFPVLERPTLGDRPSFCYTTALYTPSLLPFVAKYNDYGGGEDEGGIALELTMNAIQDILVEMEEGENPYHDIPIKKADFGPHLFWEATHEGRLFHKHYKNCGIFFAMVRKDVADRIFSEWKFNEYVGGETGYIRDLTFEKMCDSIPEFLERSISNSELFGDGIVRFDWELDSPISKRLSYISSASSNNWDLLKMNVLVSDLVNSDKMELAVDFLRLYMIGSAVDVLMDETRRIWLPMMHRGSQSGDLKAYQFVNGLVEDEIEKEKSTWGEY
jgi:hypothetical protein